MTTTATGTPRVGDILTLYERWGGDPYDEEVAQLDHALQTAALAVNADAGDALVAAALLHDVGHLLVLQAGTSRTGARRTGPAHAGPTLGAGAAQEGRAVPGGPTPAEPPEPHERTGPAYLAGLFPPAVTRPIALHVAAKRYLCAIEPDYAARLSAGSQRSMRRQGGPMAPSAVAEFEATPGWKDAVSLRRWDDAGKVEAAAVPTLATYEPLLRSLVTRP